MSKQTETFQDLAQFLGSDAQTDDPAGEYREPAEGETADPDTLDATEVAPEDGEAAAPPPPARGITVGHAVGVLLLAAAGVLAMLPAAAEAGSALTRAGFSPGVLALLGAVALAAAMLMRRNGTAADRLEWALEQQAAAQESIRQSVDGLVEHASAGIGGAAGDDLARVGAALQRLDEKINNITKAVKMYGKPLMEIATQGSDTLAILGQVRTQADGLLQVVKLGFQRVEEAGKAVDGERIEQELRRLGAQVARVEAIDAQITRLEAEVRAGFARADDGELRRNLLRLQETTQQGFERIAGADGGEREAVAQRVEQNIRVATDQLQAAIAGMRDGRTEAIDAGVRGLQQELAGIATTLSRVQQAVQAGAAARSVAAPAIAPAAAASEPAPAAPPPAAAMAAEPAGDAQDGVAQNVTGERKTTGRNVLGAIAKLKQMKG